MFPRREARTGPSRCTTPSPFTGVPVGRPSRHPRVTDRLTDMSPLAKWLDAKRRASFPDDTDPELTAWVALLSQRSPRYAALLDGWRQRRGKASKIRFCLHRTCLPSTRTHWTSRPSALDQFRERADRDGVALVILSTPHMGTRGDLAFDRLTALAESRDIPVIDYNNYVLRQGAEPRDALWSTTATGTPSAINGRRKP